MRKNIMIAIIVGILILAVGTSYAWFVTKVGESKSIFQTSGLNKYLKWNINIIDDEGNITTDDTKANAQEIILQKNDNANNLTIYGNLYLIVSGIDENNLNTMNIEWKFCNEENYLNGECQSTISEGNFNGEHDTILENEVPIINNNDVEAIPLLVNEKLDNTKKYVITIGYNEWSNEEYNSKIKTSVYSTAYAENDATYSAKVNKMYIRKISLNNNEVISFEAFSSVYSLKAYSIVESNYDILENSDSWIEIANEGNSINLNQTINLENTFEINSSKKICIINDNNDIYCKEI